MIARVLENVMLTLFRNIAIMCAGIGSIPAGGIIAQTGYR
jgi:hypothetical protein|tara:strand:- start:383 stop:502 length:120 start_codon:yes stop_codon:yes gene_type:complete